MITSDLSGMLVTRRLVSGLFLMALAITSATEAQGQSKLLYTLSNDIRDGRNAVLAYQRLADGRIQPHPAGPFLTRGTGIDNDTNGKLGPNDNDTPLIMTPDGRFLFAVNGHTNTIAAFAVGRDGSLSHVTASPFPSMGIGPVSLAVSGDVLIVANRNEDPHQLAALRGAAYADYATFHIKSDGTLRFVSKMELQDGQKNTQVLAASGREGLIFGNDFQVDVDFDGEGDVSKLFSPEPAVRGGIRSFWLDEQGGLQVADHMDIPETVEPAPEVPTIPLGIWDHPTRPLLYAGLVTRNQLGVFRYDDYGRLSFVTAVPNSGQDICWLKTSADGTRLYAVNNLPREDAQDMASTVTMFDISGGRAEKPVEIGRIELPHPFGTFINNRVAAQPNSAAFQFDLDEDAGLLYVVMQRINQTDANMSDDGNVIHTVKVDASGSMEVVASRHLKKDGVSPRARPHGMLVVDLVG